MQVAKAVPVLMHHHVTPAGGMINVSPENFASQIAWLARDGWTSLTLDQFAGFLAGEPVPRKSILITFDDGYLDNWVHAHPILQRYGMHAVLFLVSGWVGDGPVRAHAAQAASPLPTPAHRDCEAAIADGRADAVMIRWSEARQMIASGSFEVHCHTHSHRRWYELGLPPQTLRQVLSEDLQRSRQTLQRELGPLSDHLCWPFGYFDADYLAVAREQGFSHLHTIHAFGRNLPGGDREHIYRFPVRNRPASWLQQRIRASYHPVQAPLFNRFKAWRRGLPPGA
ncbi:MAG TPA: polysaccharide deacetylase family protein [Stenotrophomonas sp.]|nr:polysaccharide deacetylase family protein [Stenotrophomonas sp.]